MKNLKNLDDIFEEINSEPFLLKNNKQLKNINLLKDTDNEDFELTVKPKQSIELSHQKNSLSSNTFFNSSDINSFDGDRLDKLLGIPLEDSYVLSEGLIMDDDIDFLSRSCSSASNTSLNYSDTEVMSSVFDSFYPENAFRLSANNSQNYSDFLLSKSFETQDPGNIIERFDLDCSPTERITQRMIQKKIRQRKTKNNCEKNDDVSYIVPSGLLDKNSEKSQFKEGNEEMSCCRQCLIS